MRSFPKTLPIFGGAKIALPQESAFVPKWHRPVIRNKPEAVQAEPAPVRAEPDLVQPVQAEPDLVQAEPDLVQPVWVEPVLPEVETSTVADPVAEPEKNDPAWKATMTKAELLAVAKELGVEASNSNTKAEILAALDAHK